MYYLTTMSIDPFEDYEAGYKPAARVTYIIPEKLVLDTTAKKPYDHHHHPKPYNMKQLLDEAYKMFIADPKHTFCMIDSTVVNYQGRSVTFLFHREVK